MDTVDSSEAPASLEPEPRVPAEPLPRLFWRFLRFGLLAWGGPIAQIAMIRQELVEEEKWVSPAHFNRTLALYQILPGPEAHELCVYFGMLARGRVGGLLAGLGFMLPGLLLMLLCSWLYVRVGLDSPWVRAAFTTVQAAVAALIVRAVHRIGGHAFTRRSLLVIALLAAVAQLVGVPFFLTLAWAGLTAVLLHAGSRGAAVALTAGCALAAGLLLTFVSPESAAPLAASPAGAPQGVLSLLGSGLRTGLLTFGGAYTAIPFLQRDAVARGGWMTDAQFLDGLALGGVLPAPLIIFGTFVGYLGGGLPGALAMTAGIFAPAFGMTLLAHHPLERLVHHPRARILLDGVTAGVVGLIGGTALPLLRAAVDDVPTGLVFAGALVVLFRAKARLAPMAVLAAAALVGLGVHAFSGM
ncbi:chromate efflux transporter [Hyalangium rubrum]|uniref:Chromate efflux transporter n=1 Tax=Hyalangium rubrum TaxID=3103134 RepID=A0ABU5GXP5_9BACT|nr:chromate efflux transporter [Hyalangium sp. s54d21]MDY7225811.1 chromate efflux transporter [Hyalangium sp. s54d21]